MWLPIVWEDCRNLKEAYVLFVWSLVISNYKPVFFAILVGLKVIINYQRKGQICLCVSCCSEWAAEFVLFCMCFSQSIFILRLTIYICFDSKDNMVPWFHKHDKHGSEIVDIIIRCLEGVWLSKKRIGNCPHRYIDRIKFVFFRKFFVITSGEREINKKMKYE